MLIRTLEELRLYNTSHALDDLEPLMGIIDNVEKDILASLSRTREVKNVNQYFFLDYLYYKGLVVNNKIPKKHFSMAIASPKSIGEFIENPTRQFVCINDVQLSKERYEKMRTTIIEAFEKRFPNPSKYEL